MTVATNTPIVYTRFIENLMRFNRKERHYLLAYATGVPTLGAKDSIPPFSLVLSEQFRRAVGALFDVKIPETAYVAMDYHLDWIHACLWLTLDRTRDIYNRRGIPPIKDSINENAIPTNDLSITGSIEDIDLLIAWSDTADPEYTQLILMEAKCDSSFSNAQTTSKINRLGNTFPDNNYCKSAKIIPHLGLVSPREPDKGKLGDAFKDWMLKPSNGKLYWISLPTPKKWSTIVRCDQAKNNCKTDNYWRERKIQKQDPIS